MFILYLEKAEESKIKLLTSVGSQKKQESSGKTLTFAVLTMLKPLCRSQQTVENSSRDRNTRPSYLPPEKSVCRWRRNRTGQRTADWFQMRNGVCEDFILSPYIFNFYAEYIMWNTRLDEAQDGIKIARRFINNFRYADNTTHMAESKEELKSQSLDEGERGEWKSWLKTQHLKTKIMASGPITSWKIDRETMETVTDFIFGGLQNHCRWWLHPWN